MKALFRLLVPVAALVLPSVVIAQQDSEDDVIEEVVTRWFSQRSQAAFSV